MHFTHHTLCFFSSRADVDAAAVTIHLGNVGPILGGELGSAAVSVASFDISGPVCSAVH
jgi:hypothetical protein